MVKTYTDPPRRFGLTNVVRLKLVFRDDRDPDPSSRERREARKRAIHDDVGRFVESLNTRLTDPGQLAGQRFARTQAKHLLLNPRADALMAADLAPARQEYPDSLPYVLIIESAPGELIDLGEWEGLPVLRAPRLSPILRIARSRRRADFRCCPSCARFFFAAHDRQIFCEDRCKELARPPEKRQRAQYMRDYRQHPAVKVRVTTRKRRSRAK
jgi:hypothetical protein